MTNDPTLGNAVVGFNRAANGTLTPMAGSPFMTGELGGANRDGAVIDFLTSQGSLQLTQDGNWLLACNAGINNITVFRVKPGGLVAMSPVGSGGTFPVSLAVSGNNVFVLNDTGKGTANIVGFKLYGGNLVATGASYSLPSTGFFTQVGFTPDGRWLIVTDKGEDKLLVFSATSVASGPKSTYTYASAGTGPFAFTFDANGHLLVVQVGDNAVSSFNVWHGTLAPITLSVPNGQAASCWIVGNQMGDLYTANPGATTISLYKENNYSGKINSAPIGAEFSGIHPIDMGITGNGKFLYAVDPPTGGIDGFMIMKDGSLTSLMGSPFAAGFQLSAQGIAVK